MDGVLLLLIGLVVGFIGGISLYPHLTVKENKSNDETNFATLEKIFEQYMDALTEKHEEIMREIDEWETRIVRMTNQKQGQEVHADKREQVIELLNQGYTTTTIAQKLGIGVGEVELISQLKNNQIKH